MSNLSYNPPVGMPGSVVSGGGAIRFRDSLDQARAQYGAKIPQAEYPDGYLGTIVSRRNDRMLDQLKNRLTQRSYQRGVHKGERIDPADYFWPPEFNMNSALINEAQGVRWAPRGNPVETLAAGGRPGPQDLERMRRIYGVDGQTAVAEVDPNRQALMARLLPQWR